MSEKKIGSSVQHLALEVLFAFNHAEERAKSDPEFNSPYYSEALAYGEILKQLIKVHETHNLPMTQALLDWIKLHG